MDGVGVERASRTLTCGFIYSMDALPAIGGIAYLIICIFLLVLSVYWLLFPWFVYSKLDKIIELLRDQGRVMLSISDRRSELPPVVDPKTLLPPLPGKERYYLAVGETIGGPHLADVVQGMLNRGTVTQATVFVLPVGGTKWKRLDEVFEISAAD